MQRGTLRQILLLTDGCSNSGVNPLVAAKEAFEMGVTVNVIGILEEGKSELDPSFREVEEIAKAGGGIHQVVFKEELSHTVQAVTRQAMAQTLQGVINRELTEIFGRKQSVAEIDPEKREEVMEVVEEVGETCDLEVMILVDTSASMQQKLMTVKEALIDLSMNLQARSGMNEFAVYQFPKRKQSIGRIHAWTNKLAPMSVIFPKLVTGGLTPTGSAIQAAVEEWGHGSGFGYAEEG